MDFYTNIAEYYDFIFPYNEAHKTFIEGSINDPNNKSLLDIGCGTGNLSFELSKIFNKVEAIDIDELMIKKAEEKYAKGYKNNLHFRCKDMLEINKIYPPKCFDIIISFGNTIVHLNNKKEISNLFEQAYNILKPNGKLLFQIINYERILENSLKGLPTIENNQIKFERFYNYLQSEEKIEFITILEVKETQKKIYNKVKLYPIYPNTIQNLLEKDGFKNIKFYGDFQKGNLTKESKPLIIEASK